MSRRREKKPVDDGPGWLATYGDLVTLLLAFFVMLFAVADVESQKFKAFLSGLGHFKNSAAQPGVWPANTSPGQLTIDPGIGAVQPSRDVTKTQDEIDAVETQLEKAIREAGLEDRFTLRADARGIAAVLATDDVLFPSGSATMSERGLAAIDAIAAIIRSLEHAVTVEGHTDSTPLNRGGYTNWHLSSDRAVAVVHRLMTGGISPARLSAIGHGEHKPLTTEATPEDQLRNRRVELVIHMRAPTAGETVASGDVSVGPPPIEVRPPTATPPPR